MARYESAGKELDKARELVQRYTNPLLSPLEHTQLSCGARKVRQTEEPTIHALTILAAYVLTLSVLPASLLGFKRY